MSDTSVRKVSATTAPRGRLGQRYLASGVRLAMRMWENEEIGDSTSSSERDYETIGYVIRGRAELKLEGQTVLLEPGDCWIVPVGSRHSYSILEPFTAVEATSPPARAYACDSGSRPVSNRRRY